jgi:hypothetical protein
MDSGRRAAPQRLGRGGGQITELVQVVRIAVCPGPMRDRAGSASARWVDSLAVSCDRGNVNIVGEPWEGNLTYGSMRGG